jgi:iron(III) transport system ATP-binding protein
VIQIQNLKKVYRPDVGTSVVAVHDLNLFVPEGAFLTLLGLSGCGKTTILRCLAGLERPDSGSISINGRKVFSHADGIEVPAHKRDLGMVFQSYAIWPHMSVFDNVAFSLRYGKRQRDASARKRVMEALELVGLSATYQRNATLLSGGQQQRLALARALVSQPKILLLDEPLSNLDASLREEMRRQLRDLHDEVGVTTVYVTHDQEEALSLSTRVVVVNGGSVVQEGSPEELYSAPRTAFVASFIGGCNLLTGKAVDGGRCFIDGAGEIGIDADVRSGSAVCVGVRPERIRLTTSDARASDADTSGFTGVIVGRMFLGRSREYRLRLDGGAELRVSSPADVTFSLGDQVSAFVRLDDWLHLKDEPGQSTIS